MFLRLLHDDDSSLLEVLQEPQGWPKAQLRFPSGEALPACWLHPPHRS